MTVEAMYICRGLFQGIAQVFS